LFKKFAVCDKPIIHFEFRIGGSKILIRLDYDRSLVSYPNKYFVPIKIRIRHDYRVASIHKKEILATAGADVLQSTLNANRSV
jgi:predicted HTH transcriptional regulator